MITRGSTRAAWPSTSGVKREPMPPAERRRSRAPAPGSAGSRRTSPSPWPANPSAIGTSIGAARHAASMPPSAAPPKATHERRRRPRPIERRAQATAGGMAPRGHAEHARHQRGGGRAAGDAQILHQRDEPEIGAVMLRHHRHDGRGARRGAPDRRRARQHARAGHQPAERGRRRTSSTACRAGIPASVRRSLRADRQRQKARDHHADHALRGDEGRGRHGDRLAPRGEHDRRDHRADQQGAGSRSALNMAPITSDRAMSALQRSAQGDLRMAASQPTWRGWSIARAFMDRPFAAGSTRRPWPVMRRQARMMSMPLACPAGKAGVWRFFAAQNLALPAQT